MRIAAIPAALIVMGFAPPESISAPEFERSFVDGAFGQTHLTTALPPAASSKPALVLFHPTPYSGDFFTAFMKEMASDRIVIAIDTPGYGDSVAPPDLPTIEDYARNASMVLRALGYGDTADKAIDVLGYHTGALIAAELAVIDPGLVRKAVLPGVPYMTGAERKEAYTNNAVAPLISADGAHLAGPWKLASYAVPVGLPLKRAQELYNDAMQCYPDCWKGYHAVFTYESENRLPLVTQPTLLLGFDGSLARETQGAAALIAGGRFELMPPEAAKGGFDLAPKLIADEVRHFLDE